jgi:hypothetical protein
MPRRLQRRYERVAADAEPLGRERHVSVTLTHVSQHIFAHRRCGAGCCDAGAARRNGLIAKLARQIS